MEVLTLEAARASGVLATLCRKTSTVTWSDAPDIETRVQNCMRNSGREHVWQMTCQKEGSLKKTKNYGRRCHVYVENALANLGLSFGMMFAPDLCDEIERVTGMRPEPTPISTAPTERLPAPAPPPEPIPSLADRMLKMRAEAIARRNQLAGEITLLNNLNVAIDSGLVVAVNEQSPEELRRFFAECGKTPTTDQITARVDALEKTVTAIDHAFKGSARGTAFENWLAVAHILDAR